MNALLQGFGIGLAIAAPVGPIGMLCIRRSLNEGARLGLATGLGAATADALYGLVVASGLTLTGWLLSHGSLLRALGALLLVALGLGVWRRLLQPPAAAGATAPARSTWAAFAGTLLLTLANPATLVSFLGVVAALGQPGQGGSAYALVLGVFLGSLAWWCFLVALVRATRHWLPAWALRAIDVLTGALLVGTGLWVAFSLLKP
ncbi:LysE family transporter [Inhella proteolytica]|uniref:LysE family transporter n=1 Tax=Inhella proteolytica TaxID=2795029 RepID=A0A931J0C4_9BURK|nr:LysE family transporter [Inhella proteolytica]MBH9576383.1 LysE family transporter [Inhella proteolytica]